MNATLKKSIAEFVGVAVFLTAIISSTQIASRDGGFANLALGATLGLMILLTAGTSGGHLNPAVSLYFYAKKAISLNTLLSYIIAQLLGAAAGVYLGKLLSGGTFGQGSVAPATTAAFVAEAFATAVLVWLVGYLAANNHGDKIPFAVGAWVVAASLFTSTGAQANPAVTFGLLFTGADLNYVGTIVVAELVGLVVALLGLAFVTSAPVAKATKKSKKK